MQTSKQSSCTVLAPDRLEKRACFTWRPQVMNALRRRRLRHTLPVPGRQAAMAKPDDLVAGHRAAPDRAPVWPALRRRENTLEETLRHPPVMSQQMEVNVDQSIGKAEPFRGRLQTTKAIDDPSILLQNLGVLFKYSSRHADQNDSPESAVLGIPAGA
jgi:hypothetical protein